MFSALIPSPTRAYSARPRPKTGKAIGSLLAQGLSPFGAARLGVYLHGLAGDGARERFGDAGVLAGDLPEGLAIARRRLAAIAERQTTDKRLGFRVREPTEAPQDADAARA